MRWLMLVFRSASHSNIQTWFQIIRVTDARDRCSPNIDENIAKTVIITSTHLRGEHPGEQIFCCVCCVTDLLQKSSTEFFSTCQVLFFKLFQAYVHHKTVTEWQCFVSIVKERINYIGKPCTFYCFTESLQLMTFRRAPSMLLVLMTMDLQEVSKTDFSEVKLLEPIDSCGQQFQSVFMFPRTS